MLKPKVGRRVRFNTWHRGGSANYGPEDRSKYTGEVIEIKKEDGWKTRYAVKRDEDGEIQFCESVDLLEYVQ